MNEIRIDKEEEKDIVKAKFKIPAIVIVPLCILVFNAVLLIVVGVHFFQEEINNYHYTGPDGSSYLAFGITVLIIVLPIFILWMVGIKKSSCVITNKRIYGVTSIFIARKKYSYRLDEIDNVETTSTLGVHGLSLNFSQGHGTQGVVVRYNRGATALSGAGTFRITNISNIDEVYEKLSNMLTSIKTDKDLMVDIEMSKIDAEQRKAAAFESIATNISANSAPKPSSNQGYIEELKGLKELLDAGIISEEEFNEKKKSLLKND